MGNKFKYAIAFALLTALFFFGLAAGADQGQAASAGEKELTDAERQQAKDYFIAGSEAYSKKDYKTAIDKFKRAFEIVRSPEILFNIGRCHEELGETEDAIYHYEMYLRFYPTADDADDVKRRIEALREAEKGEGAGQEGAEGDSGLYEEAGPEDEMESGIRLAASLGLSVPVFGEWALRMVIPIQVTFHYPILDWLFVTAMGMYGAPVYGDEPTDPGEITSLLGIMLGANAIFYRGQRIDLEGGVGIMPVRVARQHYENAIWLAFPATFDAIIKLYKGWRLITGVSVDFGPVFNRKNNQGDEWTSNPKPTLSLTARIIGLEYMF